MTADTVVEFVGVVWAIERQLEARVASKRRGEAWARRLCPELGRRAMWKRWQALTNGERFAVARWAREAAGQYLRAPLSDGERVVVEAYLAAVHTDCLEVVADV